MRRTRIPPARLCVVNRPTLDAADEGENYPTTVGNLHHLAAI
jgi:hypothetical protein